MAPHGQTGGWLNWVSGFQLYLDFLMTVGNRGPLYLARKWVDINDEVTMEMPCVYTRVHAFTHVFQQYWTSRNFVVPSRHTRPNGGSISCRLQCFRSGWKLDMLKLIDEHVFSVLGGQLSHVKMVDKFTEIPPRAV